MTKILVVDDDEVLLEILRNVITNQMSLECDVANNGKVALAACEKNDYELVITDARMPEMNGLELLAALKERYPKLDVIVMTGFTNEYSFLEVIRAGASDYLAKPLSIHEIEAKISRVLRERTVMKDLLEHNLRLQENAPCLEHVFRHILRDFVLRCDGVAEERPALGRNRAPNNGFVALHQHLLAHHLYTSIATSGHITAHTVHALHSPVSRNSEG